MSTDGKLAPEEISRRIVTGMGLVHDLLSEMSAFFRMLLDGLQASELDTRPLMGKAARFSLPKPRRGRSAPLYSLLKTDMGVMVELGVASGDEDDLGEDEDAQERDIEQKGISITPESQFLAVRASLYDPEKAKAQSFEPTVTGVLLSSLRRVRTGKRPKAADTVSEERGFQLSRAHLQRVMWQVDPQLEKGQAISWRIPRYQLQATVAGIEKRPLVDFDSEEKVNSFMDALIALAESE